MSNPFADIKKFRIAIADHVAVVSMNAPPVNAQGCRFRVELVRIFDTLSLDSSVRVIILTGSGSTFSAGADLKERGAIADVPGGNAEHNRLVRNCFDAIAECPKPVIAAVNGAAIGSGAGLAFAADILVVAEDAYVAYSEVDYGLAGGARYAMRVLGPSNARLMIYTARRFSGADLYRLNVASLCVPRDQLFDEAMAIAREIADKAPLAIAAAKRAFIVTEEMPVRDGYRYEQTQTAALAASEDTQEALAAFRERRKPVFRGR